MDLSWGATATAVARSVTEFIRSVAWLRRVIACRARVSSGVSGGAATPPPAAGGATADSDLPLSLRLQPDASTRTTTTGSQVFFMTGFPRTARVGNHPSHERSILLPLASGKEKIPCQTFGQ